MRLLSLLFIAGVALLHDHAGACPYGHTGGEVVTPRPVGAPVLAALVNESLAVRGRDLGVARARWEVRSELVLRNPTRALLTLRLGIPFGVADPLRTIVLPPGGHRSPGLGEPLVWGLEVEVDGKRVEVRAESGDGPRVAARNFAEGGSATWMSWEVRIAPGATARVASRYLLGVQSEDDHDPLKSYHGLLADPVELVLSDGVELELVVASPAEWGRAGKSRPVRISVDPGERYRRCADLRPVSGVGRGAERPLTWTRIAAPLTQVCLKLAGAHARNLVHNFGMAAERIAELDDADLLRVASLPRARHGEAPASPGLRALLSRQFWYRPRTGFSDRLLDPRDRALLHLVDGQLARRPWLGRGRRCATGAPPSCRAARGELAAVGALLKSDPPALAKLLGQGEREVRLAVVATLPLLGRSALPPLVRALADREPAVRWNAANGLVALAKTVPVRYRPAEGLAEYALQLTSGERRAAARALAPVARERDEAVALEAITALEELAAEPELIALLGERTPYRAEACSALGKSRSPALVRAAALALEDPSAEVRDCAARRLHSLGRGAASAAPALRRALEAAIKEGGGGCPRPSSECPLAALADALQVADPDSAPLVLRAVLRTPAYLRLFGTSEILANAGAAAKVRDALIVVRRKDPAWQLRARAVTLLSELAGARRRGGTLRDPRLASTVFGELAEATADPHPQVRRLAISELGGARVLARETRTLEPLVAAASRRIADRLGDRDASARRAAVSALSALELRGAAARPLIAPLAGALSHSDPALREAAAALLAGLGAEAAPALAGLRRMLDDRVPECRRAAAAALAALGEAGRAALDRLRSLARDPDARVRATALAAAVSLDRPGALSLLTAALKDRDPSVREQAAQELAVLGAVALPHLTAALRDVHQDVRYAAAAALGKLGSGAAPAVPALVRALSDRQESVRRRAVESLAEIGAAAARAVPALRRCLARERGAGAKAEIEEAIKRLEASH